MNAALLHRRGAALASRSAVSSPSCYLRVVTTTASPAPSPKFSTDDSRRRRSSCACSTVVHSRSAVLSSSPSPRRLGRWSDPSRRYLSSSGGGDDRTSARWRNATKPESSSSSSSSSPLESSSEGGAGSDVNKVTSNAEFIAEHFVDPGRAVFPWRHSPSPLPRLDPDRAEDPEVRAEGGTLGPGVPPANAFVRTVMRWNAAAALGIPTWKVLFMRNAWEEELVREFTRAFELGVAGMLANTYSIPLERIAPMLVEDDEDKEDEDEGGGGSQGTAQKDGDDGEGDETSGDGGGGKFAVDFDRTLDPLPEITDIKDEIAAEEKKKAEKAAAAAAAAADKAGADDDDEECCPEIQHMLQHNLRSLYQTAHEHARHKLEIRLRTQPTSARLESLFIIPCLTRQHVEHTPALRHSFRNVWKELEKQERQLGRKLSIMEASKVMGEGLLDLAHRTVRSDGVVEQTVVAQVSIRCNEIFTVRDVDLDEVVQGDPQSNTNDVVHLVRFEVTVGSHMDTGELIEMGSWQITDWDDLLGGNIWFV